MDDDNATRQPQPPASPAEGWYKLPSQAPKCGMPHRQPQPPASPTEGDAADDAGRKRQRTAPGARGARASMNSAARRRLKQRDGGVRRGSYMHQRRQQQEKERQAAAATNAEVAWQLLQSRRERTSQVREYRCDSSR